MARMATATRTRSPQINIGITKPGAIVPYVPPVPASQSPQVVTPMPRGTYSNPPPASVPKSPQPDIIDAEIVGNGRVRRPVVSSDARPSSQSASPQWYPQYPNPADAWSTAADFAAWQNGKSKESIDLERSAYEWANRASQGFGTSAQRVPPELDIGAPFYDYDKQIQYNIDLANRYRARNGLPSVDRNGREQGQPSSPSNQPSSDFDSNPFKTSRRSPNTPATPVSFPESPYNFDIDPDTGFPYTPLQKQRGEELGRPAWHIDPTTGNPWGSDEVGVPIPLPFDGAPGGVGKYPIPDQKITPVQWAVPLVLTHSSPFARGRGRYVYYVNSTQKPVTSIGNGGPQPSAFGPSNGTSYWVTFIINGEEVSRNGNGDTNESGEWEVFGTYWEAPYPVGFSGEPVPGGDPSFTPIGKPLPNIQPNPDSRVSPTGSPAPVQDPRVKPSPQPRLPTTTAPGGKGAPSAPAPLTRPNPRPYPQPLPSIPGQPNYAPGPSPYPNPSPTGTPRPNRDSSGQPSPARPSNPAPTETIDRPKYPPVNPAPKSGDCNPCPDPCEKESLVEIRYKKFIGCNVLPSGEPDRFREAKIEVPESSSLAIKSMLDSIADIRAQECAPCCFWDIEKGNAITIYNGKPNPVGQEFSIPLGAASVIVKYNAVEALSDNTVRSLKRIAKDGNPANTFCNVGVIWLIDDRGDAISSTEIWTVGTVIQVPFEYRDRIMKIRLMPKSVGINFTILDSGDRWVQRVE